MTHLLEYDRMPSPLLGFAKAAVARGSGLAEGQSVPRIVARCRGVVADEKALRKYRSLCSFRNDGHLPVTFPHILAAPLHLQLLTHPAFPFKLLGAVHVRNRITQHRRIPASEVLDIEVSVEGQRDVDAGYEFDIEARVTDTLGELVWDATSTMLIRRRSGGGSGKSGWTPPDWGPYRLVESWKVPEDIGRRYGVVAGDVNPIHMHKLAARPFGFKRAIAHGMWSYARVAARLLPASVEAVTVSVAFKRPVFLPGRVELLVDEARGQSRYLLTNAERDTVFLEGECITTADEASASAGAAAGSKPAAKKASRKAAKKAAKKASGKSSATRATAAGKSTARKSAAKKSGAKKSTAKKSTAKKGAAKKGAGRKAAAVKKSLG